MSFDPSTDEAGKGNKDGDSASLLGILRRFDRSGFEFARPNAKGLIFPASDGEMSQKLFSAHVVAFLQLDRVCPFAVHAVI